MSGSNTHSNRILRSHASQQAARNPPLLVEETPLENEQQELVSSPDSRTPLEKQYDLLKEQYSTTQQQKSAVTKLQSSILHQMVTETLGNEEYQELQSALARNKLVLQEYTKLLTEVETQLLSLTNVLQSITVRNTLQYSSIPRETPEQNSHNTPEVRETLSPLPRGAHTPLGSPPPPHLSRQSPSDFASAALALTSLKLPEEYPTVTPLNSKVMTIKKSDLPSYDSSNTSKYQADCFLKNLEQTFQLYRLPVDHWYLHLLSVVDLNTRNWLERNSTSLTWAQL